METRDLFYEYFYDSPFLLSMVVKINMVVSLAGEYSGVLKNLIMWERNYAYVLSRYYSHRYRTFHLNPFGIQFFLLSRAYVGLYVCRKASQIYIQNYQILLFVGHTYLQLSTFFFSIPLGYKSNLKQVCGPLRGKNCRQSWDSSCLGGCRLDFKDQGKKDRRTKMTRSQYYANSQLQNRSIENCKYTLKIKILSLNNERYFWIIAFEDLNALKLRTTDFTIILLLGKTFMHNRIIVFQKIFRNIIYQFSTRSNGYRKKRTIQLQISLTKKGEVFQKDVLLHRMGSSGILRHSISRNPGGQYDPRLFTSKRRTNLCTLCTGGGES